ncbi:MAG: hypothetical protein ACREXN_12340 [Polaromonas sp.]
MKVMPLAAAMTAALVFGAAAQAQSGAAATSNTATGIGGTTKAQDALVNPAPMAGKDGKVARQNDGDSGSAKRLGATGIAGTTSPQDALVNPAPTAGKDGKVARQNTTDSGSAKNLGATGIGGTTSKLDNMSPAPEGGKAMTAEERAAAKAAKAEKKAARVAQRAERRSKDAATGDLRSTILDPSRN